MPDLFNTSKCRRNQNGPETTVQTIGQNNAGEEQPAAENNKKTESKLFNISAWIQISDIEKLENLDKASKKKLVSIFQVFDDGNGILDKSETERMLACLKEAAAADGNNSDFSKKDADKLVKSLGTKKVSRKDVQEFFGQLEGISKKQSKNVVKINELLGEDTDAETRKALIDKICGQDENIESIDRIDRDAIRIRYKENGDKQSITEKYDSAGKLIETQEIQNFSSSSWEANSHTYDRLSPYSYKEITVKDCEGRIQSKKVYGLVDVNYEYKYNDDDSYAVKSDYDKSEKIYDAEGKLQEYNFPDVKGKVVYNDDGSYAINYDEGNEEESWSWFYDKNGIATGHKESGEYEDVIYDAQTQTYSVGEYVYDAKQFLSLKGPSGMQVKYSPDGNKKEEYNDGTSYSLNKDGSEKVEYNDGTSYSFNKDGMLVEAYCNSNDNWKLRVADFDKFIFDVTNGVVTGTLQITVTPEGDVEISYVDEELGECEFNIKDDSAINAVKQDIKEHHSDIKKLTVDMLRLKDVWCSLVNGNGDGTEITALNGKLDIPSEQGDIGDCWLISAINACKTRPEIKKELENLIKLDGRGGAYVTLKGARDEDENIKPVTYHITAKELKSSSYLASGDGDTRLFEIAMDKYIRDEAYEGRSYHFNISGNKAEFFLKTALDMEISRVEYSSIAETEDFNNQEKLYTLSSSDASFLSIEARHADGSSAKLSTNHAYNIIREDENNMYFCDPNYTENSEESFIIVSKSDLLKSKIDIGIGWHSVQNV